ncbi:MAG: Rieske (2Fe-2S) protein, partial [Gemmatimonadetes bacterium]|nr:Rieske (2Fe-2S) protein [Gemmatimonadota bacterium]
MPDRRGPSDTMTRSPLPSTPSDGLCPTCGSCPDRRSFLKTGLGTAALAALAAMLPGGAAGLEVRAARATAAGGLLRFSLPASDGVHIDTANEVILVRRGGTISAFALSCPHQRSMLRWREADGIFQCSKHHSEYSALGVYQKGRATRNMDRLAVRLEGNEIVVDPASVFESDKDPQGWAGAVVTVG